MDVRYRGHRLPLTASFGVAELPASDHDMIDYVELADAALYRAKRAGRNCVATSNALGAAIEVSAPAPRGQHGVQTSNGALAS
jgi:predicted signal transduction protein with EAL and GGDEF domain